MELLLKEKYGNKGVALSQDEKGAYQLLVVDIVKGNLIVDPVESDFLKHRKWGRAITADYVLAFFPTFKENFYEKA